MIEKVICKECGKTFEAPRFKHRQFCSLNCHIKFMVRERDEGRRVWWQCPICKQWLWLQRNRAEKRKCCCVKCQAIAASQRLRGIRRKDKVTRREITVGVDREPGTHYTRVYTKGRRIRLHRYLMEQKLGRLLSSEEIVHHLDMDEGNDSPDCSNYYLYPNESEHRKGHHSLEKLVPYLLREGVIGFKDGIYIQGKGGGRGKGTGRQG